MKSHLTRLHPTILVLASTHFFVDGFGNILAPLVPLLIVDLHLSLAAAVRCGCASSSPTPSPNLDSDTSRTDGARARS